MFSQGQKCPFYSVWQWNDMFTEFRHSSQARWRVTLRLSEHRRELARVACLRSTAIRRRQWYKKLIYRRGTARCVVSVEILPIATQQCRNYLYDKSWTKYQLSLIGPRDKIVLYTELDDLCDKLQWSSVGAGRYYKLSWPTTAQFITLWASTFLEQSWYTRFDYRYAVAKFSKCRVWSKNPEGSTFIFEGTWTSL